MRHCGPFTGRFSFGHFFAMTELLIFCAGTAFFAWVSRRALLNPRSHGFYRFIAWECMLVLVLINFPMWTVDPFSARQIVSWLLLASSIALAVNAVRLLKQIGRPGSERHRSSACTTISTARVTR